MKKKTFKSSINKNFLLTLIKLAAVILFLLILTDLLPNIQNFLHPLARNTTSNSETVIRRGNPFDNSWQKITFRGCGTNLPRYSYYINLPANWTVKKITNKAYSSDKFDSVFTAEGDGKYLQINCTTNGVGGDICDKKYWTKFTIVGKIIEACYGQIDEKWNMGVLNLPRDPSTQAIIAFWAKSMDKLMLDKIFSSFKILGNQ